MSITIVDETAHLPTSIGGLDVMTVFKPLGHAVDPGTPHETVVGS